MYRIIRSIFLTMVVSLVFLVIPGTASNESPYPLIEEFNSSDGFTFTEPDRLFIDDGKVVWDLTQSVMTDQYIYRSIPEFDGNFRLTVYGQIDTHTGNHQVGIGIGEDIGAGPNIVIGYYGTLCPNEDYFIGAEGVEMEYGELSCKYYGDWLWIDNGAPYIVILNIVDGEVNLEVEGIGHSSGSSSYSGGYDMLWIGAGGDNDWHGVAGSVDYVIIEPLIDGGQNTLSIYLPFIQFASHRLNQ